MITSLFKIITRAPLPLPIPSPIVVITTLIGIEAAKRILKED